MKSGKDATLRVLDNDEPGLDGEFDLVTLEVLVEPLHAKKFGVSDDRIQYQSEKGYVGPDMIRYGICTTKQLCTSTIVSLVVGA